MLREQMMCICLHLSSNLSSASCSLTTPCGNNDHWRNPPSLAMLWTAIAKIETMVAIIHPSILLPVCVSMYVPIVEYDALIYIYRGV